MSPVIGPVLSRELVSRRLSALRWLTRNAATPTYTAYTCTCARAFAFARVPVKNFSTLESLHWLGNGERVSFCLVVRFETNDFVFWYVRIFYFPSNFAKGMMHRRFSFFFLPRNERFWERLSTFVSTVFWGKIWGILGKGNNARVIFLINFLLIPDTM